MVTDAVVCRLKSCVVANKRYSTKQFERYGNPMTDAQALCLIPARGTSSGLPKKNFKRIDGTSLVGHTTQAAQDAVEIAEVVISTEDEELAEIARDHGAGVPFMRPPELSESGVLLNEVIDHAIERLKAEGGYDVEARPIVVLQPNVPFTRAEDIDKAIRKYRQNGQRAVISVVEEREFFWQARNEHLEPFHEERTLRSELDPFYRETGAIYVTNESILAGGDRVGENPSYIVTDKMSAFEVDSLYDLWLAEKMKKGPTILFRVDGGSDIGMGHVYRCLKLTQELRDTLACEIVFLCDEQYQSGIEKIRSAGFEVVSGDVDGDLAPVKFIDPDIIFLDVLNTDEQYVKALHQVSAAVINLEDLGGGVEHADYVVNALYEDFSGKENQFFGVDYLVLEDRFIEKSIKVRPEVKHVLVTFGGSDPSNLSTQIAAELGSSGLEYDYRLILGPDFGYDEQLQRLPDDVLSEFDIYRDVSEMAEMMEWADVAICSGGRTVYELAAMGVPAIVIAHNEREARRMEKLASLNIVEYLGRKDELGGDAVTDSLIALDTDYEYRQRLSENGQEYVDGEGIRRILNIIHSIMIS